MNFKSIIYLITIWEQLFKYTDKQREFFSVSFDFQFRFSTNGSPDQVFLL